MSNEGPRPGGPERGDSAGRSEAEEAKRNAVLDAEKQVIARLALRRLTLKERENEPQGGRIDRARKAVSRAWTERGDRKLERRATRAGFDDPRVDALARPIDTARELDVEVDSGVSSSEDAAIGRAREALREPQVTGEDAAIARAHEAFREAPASGEDAAIARAHEILDTTGENQSEVNRADKARADIRAATTGVPESLEVQSEPARRVHGKAYVEPDDADLMAQIDHDIPEPSKLKKAWWTVANRFRRN